MAYLTIYDASLFIHLRLIVVVDTELRKQNLVLVCSQRALQCNFGFLVCHSAFKHHTPESGVVEIVNVT